MPRPHPERARSRPRRVTIVPATDLGSVEVAKRGNLYLLTDPRGDIRVDGRGLGLYDLDTRILSTSDPPAQRRGAHARCADPTGPTARTRSS